MRLIEVPLGGCVPADSSFDATLDMAQDKSLAVVTSVVAAFLSPGDGVNGKAMMFDVVPVVANSEVL